MGRATIGIMTRTDTCERCGDSRTLTQYEENGKARPWEGERVKEVWPQVYIGVEDRYLKALPVAVHDVLASVNERLICERCAIELAEFWAPRVKPADPMDIPF